MSNQNKNNALPRLPEWMNVELVEKVDGKAIVKMPVLPHLTHAEENPRVAGGVIMSLLDYTIHHALDSLLDEYEYHATIEMKINFIRPGTAGTLKSEAKIINKGRTVSIAEGTVIQEETGKIVAKTLSTETYINAKPKT